MANTENINQANQNQEETKVKIPFKQRAAAWWHKNGRKVAFTASVIAGGVCGALVTKKYRDAKDAIEAEVTEDPAEVNDECDVETGCESTTIE